MLGQSPDLLEADSLVDGHGVDVGATGAAELPKTLFDQRR